VRLPNILAIGILASTLAAGSSAQADEDDAAYCREHWFGVGQCWRRPHHHPVLTWGLELGVGHLNEGHPFAFDDGVGGVTSAGPAWGLRLGVDLLSWLGLEARYFGAFNDGKGIVTVGGDVAYLLSSGELVVRLTLPVPFARPYIFSGIGVYNFQLTGTPAARTASLLNSTTQAGVPIGVGVEFPLSWHFSLAVEATYHFQLGESFSSVDNIAGGDFSTLTGVMRFRM
jgi:Outer membrane protein beta-barrel domain